MTFVKPDGARVEVDAPIGLSVLEIAHRNNIDLEGACEGSLACSTCHVVVDPEWFDVLNEASEDEEDMLDLAFGLTHTSRLGCQIRMTEELYGLTVSLPQGTRNMMVDKSSCTRLVGGIRGREARPWHCAGPTCRRSPSNWKRRIPTPT
jgi:2Fe-2S ferredoxin